MKISYNWLKQYVEFTETPEALGHILTSTGLEVEAIEAYESVKGGLQGVVIGEVLTCEKHPNADKLKITTVDAGQAQPLHIVCGAPNVAVGQKVVVALPGSTIYPNQGEPLTIKSTKIRGELSEGMICAEDEIGIGESHAGIMILETKLTNGTAAAKQFKIHSDFVFEIGLTPNRADAASHIGVARDLKAAKDLKIDWPGIENFKVDNTKLQIPVTVENTEACPRYSAVTISNIKVGDSPDWLQARLKSIGLSPINNIVDITNFVCHEMGQPLHAFDADQITGGKVIVKTLKEGTEFKTLDEKDRKLNQHDLMICNVKEPMCIAGVFGGSKSGITEKSKNIFLESAYFSMDYIRKTAQHHQLKTDASFRFERGTDPLITVIALKRAALLIKEIAGGQISSEIVDVYPQEIKNREVLVKDKNVNRLIGKVIPRKDIFAILEKLDISILDKTEAAFRVSIPPYRVDVIQEADVIEEILRIYGFNKVELSETASTDYLAEFPEKDPDKFRRSVGEMLTGNGFFEIVTNSLTNLAYQQKLGLQFEGEPVEMLNKLSEEQGILRQTMLFTGIEVCAHNINRKQKDLKLFEFGKTYSKHKDQKWPYKETAKLGLYMTGDVRPEHWQNKSTSVTFFDLNQQVSQVLKKCAIHNPQQEDTNDPQFDYGINLHIGKQKMGVLGKVKSAIQKEFGIKQELFFAELDTALLFNSASPKLVIQEVPRFPDVRRDLSLVIDKSIRFKDIRELVETTEKQLIKQVTVFDVYEGDNIPENKKAYALSFTMRDLKKTLTDEEIEATMSKLMGAFEKKLGALIRK